MEAFAAQNDAELIYQPSLFLQHLAAYLPFTFDVFVNPTSNQRSIYITDMNPAAALYGYTDMSNVDYSQFVHSLCSSRCLCCAFFERLCRYVGYEVLYITDTSISQSPVPALDLIKTFASTASVGVTVCVAFEDAVACA